MYIQQASAAKVIGMLAVSNAMVAEEMVQVNPHYVYGNVMHCTYVHMYIYSTCHLDIFVVIVC